MKIALVLHLYQPPTQEEAIVRKIFEQCYLPLIKLIKNKKNFYLTLNVPLSLLEQADRYGYQSWIADVKDLYLAERIELMGSAAYHPLLTSLTAGEAERQIILNEYALGYYFGSKTGFEGEPTVMTKNVKGFFAPECAVNDSVIDLVDELGYDWILVDQTALHSLSKDLRSGQYYFVKGDKSIKIIARDKMLSDAISFIRDSSPTSLMHFFSNAPSTHVIALDGETFGHHNSEGISFLVDFIEVITHSGGQFVTVSQLLPELDEKKIKNVEESTWGASFEDMKNDEPRPFWSGNELQKKMRQLEEMLCFDQSPHVNFEMDPHELSIPPIWCPDKLNDLSDATKDYLKALILTMKFEHSDKFWWASKKSILGNSMLFHPGMIERPLQYASELCANWEDTLKKKEAVKLIEEIAAMLKE